MACLEHFEQLKTNTTCCRSTFEKKACLAHNQNGFLLASSCISCCLISTQIKELDPMYLNRPDYDEMKRREAIVTGMFLQRAEQMVDVVPNQVKNTCTLKN